MSRIITKDMVFSIADWAGYKVIYDLEDNLPLFEENPVGVFIDIGERFPGLFVPTELKYSRELELMLLTTGWRFEYKPMKPPRTMKFAVRPFGFVGTRKKSPRVLTVNSGSFELMIVKAAFEEALLVKANNG